MYECTVPALACVAPVASSVNRRMAVGCRVWLCTAGGTASAIASDRGAGRRLASSDVAPARRALPALSCALLGGWVGAWVRDYVIAMLLLTQSKINLEVVSRDTTQHTHRT